MRQATQFTDHQRRFVEQHARSLPSPLRSEFRRAVGRLAGGPVADGAVAAAVAQALPNINMIGDQL